MYMNTNNEDLPDGTIISQYGDGTTIPAPTQPNEGTEIENNNEMIESENIENVTNEN